jgi:membrane protease YdiL (CAAX protease family)
LNVILIMCDQAFLDGATSQALSATYTAPLLLQIIGVGIIVPISEEFFYRSVLYNRYREESSWMRAGVYSAILFALAHGSMIQMLFAMILGLVLAYSYEKFGSLLAPVIVHITVNMTSVLLTNVSGFDWLLAKPLRACIVTVVCTFIGMTVIMYLRNLNGREYPEVEGKQNREQSDN